MINLKLKTNSPEETMQIAKKLAPFLKKGDIVLLNGNLGSGKTKFVEGFLSYFDLEDEISSPTFTIVNEYTTSSNTIYHFDVYRLSDSEEFYAIGGEEYFDKGICFIEWGNIIEDVLPPSYIEIDFLKNEKNDNERTLSITAYGSNYDFLKGELS